MKTITAFYLGTCPYCRNARLAVQELIKENAVYATIPIEWYEETENPDKVKGHSYYYVPSLFVDQEKLYEAQPGQDYDTIKAHVKAAFDKVLSM